MLIFNYIIKGKLEIKFIIKDILENLYDCSIINFVKVTLTLLFSNFA